MYWSLCKNKFKCLLCNTKKCLKKCKFCSQDKCKCECECKNCDCDKDEETINKVQCKGCLNDMEEFDSIKYYRCARCEGASPNLYKDGDDYYYKCPEIDTSECKELHCKGCVKETIEEDGKKYYQCPRCEGCLPDINKDEDGYYYNCPINNSPKGCEVATHIPFSIAY